MQNNGQDLVSILRTTAELDLEIRALRNSILVLERQLKQIQRSNRRDYKAKKLVANLTEARKSLHDKQIELTGRERLTEELRRRFIELIPSTDDPLPGVSDHYPILLFPIRLETKYAVRHGSPELLVRMYPDQVCIDSHQNELSGDELRAGRLFWERCTAADTLRDGEAVDDAAFMQRKQQDKRKAWRELARQFGPARAAWIANESPGYQAIDIATLPPSASIGAPKLRGMPDYFVVRLYQGSTKVAEAQSKLVRDSLPASWTPDEESKENHPLGGTSQWIIDFPAALEVGMAVRIPLGHLGTDRLNQGFTRVIAAGVKISASAEVGTALITDILNAHHYTDGVAFLHHGTPTNNTRTARSGYSNSTQDLEKSFDMELLQQDIGDPQKPGRTNADRLAEALGIQPQSPAGGASAGADSRPVFRYIENAGDKVSSCESYLLDALWPATWDTYLKLLGIDPDSSGIGTVRTHFTQFANARGPLPAIRIGNLPYGLLPATKLRDWKASAEDWIWRNGAEETEKIRSVWAETDAGLHAVLMKLFDKFLEMASDPEAVPRIGATGDPDRELMRILAMEPTSVDYRLRTVLLDTFVRQLLWFTAPMFFGAGSAFDIAGKSPYEWAEEWQHLYQHNLGENGRLLRALTGIEVNAYPPHIHPFLLRLFTWGPGQPLSIPLLEKTSAREGIAFTMPDGTRSCLPAGGLLIELIKLSIAKTSNTSAQTHIYHDLFQLAKLPINELSELFRDCLDLSTHRLDAWITSLASKRLHAMRYRHPAGVYIGAYGWVEDLPPMSGGAPSLGYIHAPSVGQASAAAVLRSAHASYAAEGVPEAAKVNLNSHRVRMALELVDGMRRGQSLAALLGYQFERGLHDLGLDRYIDIFRDRFPIKAGKETPQQEDEAAESVAARNVVDGILLAATWRDMNPRKLSSLSEKLSDNDDKLPHELDKLLEALDAVGDLWFAEAIYQGTQGRYERMGAALDAAAGVGPIPEVEFVRTPRSSHSDTHRICALFTSQPILLPETQEAHEPRALAEPALAAWAMEMLGGDMSRIQCGVRVPSIDEDSRRVSIADCNISALDFVYMATTPPSGEESELEQVIRYTVRAGNVCPAFPESVAVPLDASADVIIDFGRLDGMETEPETPADLAISMGEAIEVARSFLQVIGNATPMHPSMLCLPEEAGISEDGLTGAASTLSGVYAAGDFTELQTRVKAAHGRLNETANHDGFKDDASDAGTICGALDKARSFGIQNTIPVSTAGDEHLVQRKKSVLEEIVKRSNRAAALIDDAASRADKNLDDAIRTLIKAMKAIFGDSFTVLPTFAMPRRDEFMQALEADILGGQGPDRIWLWLQQVALTHPAVQRMETALMLGEAWRNVPIDEDIECAERADELVASDTYLQRVRLAQLPFRALDRWIALSKDEYGDLSSDELADLEARPQGCLSLAIYSPGMIDPRRPVSGILIDQWEERIPQQEETTGLSFHYDQPNAQAPQALLLAVPGEWSAKETSWRLSDLFAILYDTMDLVRVRAVDLDALRHLGQFLPALYFSNATAQWDKKKNAAKVVRGLDLGGDTNA